ncbi:MAG: DUF2283 domain-containing protein [Nanoarchaeota archaeon]|nr:DUF2283 domain-containing protein [Nanoarchaeota archaeon]
MDQKIKFNFEYSNEDDVLSIFDYDKSIDESIEFNEFINVDLGKNGEVAGLEIFDVSKFLSVLNKSISKDFLNNLEKVELVQADYRNNIFIAIVFYSHGKQVYQQLPPLQKRDYVSPLIAST